MHEIIKFTVCLFVCFFGCVKSNPDFCTWAEPSKLFYRTPQEINLSEPGWWCWRRKRDAKSGLVPALSALAGIPLDNQVSSTLNRTWCSVSCRSSEARLPAVCWVTAKEEHSLWQIFRLVFIEHCFNTTFQLHWNCTWCLNTLSVTFEVHSSCVRNVLFSWVWVHLCVTSSR